MQNFQYRVGFSLKEFNQISGTNFADEEIAGLLSQKGFEYKKIVVENALRRTIPICMDAVYKNPSSMRTDAPQAFSCSSLISYLYTEAGVWMPSLSIDKYLFGTSISKEELEFGDLIFSNTGNGMIRTETVEYMSGTKIPEGVDHVGIYLGENEVLHATKKHGRMVIETLDDFGSVSKIVGFRRVADMNEERYVVVIQDDKKDLRTKENLIAEIMKKQHLS